MLQEVIAQQYKLIPNPNNGNFVLQQTITDINPVNAEIWNEIGQNVLTQQILFANNQSNINIGEVASGLYLVKLIDSKGKLYTIKFVVK